MSLADLPLVLTVEEVADVLRISRGAAYDGVRSGSIPSVRVGRTIRVPRHALAAMLAHNDRAQPEVAREPRAAA